MRRKVNNKIFQDEKRPTRQDPPVRATLAIHRAGLTPSKIDHLITRFDHLEYGSVTWTLGITSTQTDNPSTLPLDVSTRKTLIRQFFF